MISYTNECLFKSEADTIVNPVNCVGVMGAGLAKLFRERYPEMFARYKFACDLGLIGGTLGPFVWRADDYTVVNLPTKRDWRDRRSNLGLIEDGLRALRDNADSLGRIAMPRLGCGLGGLKWTKHVGPLVERYLGDLDVTVCDGRCESQLPLEPSIVADGDRWWFLPKGKT